MAHYKGAASEGNRAAQLMKKREKAKEELERLKQKISEVCATERGRESERGREGKSVGGGVTQVPVLLSPTGPCIERQQI